MKILHTSDWHIGKKLYNKSIDETLEYFFSWLEKIIAEEEIDILLVAGDIFNTPYPSQTSLKLYYQTLFKLSKTNLRQIIIIGGNHDSVSNLNAPKEILYALDITVIGGVPEKTEDLIIEIKNEKQETELVVAAVPFLRERDIRISETGQTFKERLEKINKGIENFYNKVSENLYKFKEKNIPIIGMGHLFVSDVSDVDEEEKERVVGGLQQIKSSQIPEIFDYFALGHIHKALRVGRKDNFRYSGSPIQLSFSEINNKNQIIIADFKGKDIKIQQIFVPKFRNLLHLKGTFAQISQNIENYTSDKKLQTWTDIEIVEQKEIPNLDKMIQELKERTKNIEIIRSRYTFTDIQDEIEKKFEQKTNLKDLKPVEIFDKILENYTEKDKSILRDTFIELVHNHIDI